MSPIEKGSRDSPWPFQGVFCPTAFPHQKVTFVVGEDIRPTTTDGNEENVRGETGKVWVRWRQSRGEIREDRKKEENQQSCAGFFPKARRWLDEVVEFRSLAKGQNKWKDGRQKGR